MWGWVQSGARVGQDGAMMAPSGTAQPRGVHSLVKKSSRMTSFGKTVMRDVMEGMSSARAYLKPSTVFLLMAGSS